MYIMSHRCLLFGLFVTVHLYGADAIVSVKCQLNNATATYKDSYYDQRTVSVDMQNLGINGRRKLSSVCDVPIACS
jgi:hypothetical protein